MTLIDATTDEALKVHPEIVEPNMDRLLIRLHDRYKDNLTSGEHGAQIFMPDQAKRNARRPATGTIVRVGDWVGRHLTPDGKLVDLPARAKFVEGVHVYLQAFTAYEMEMPEGRESENGLWVIAAEAEILGFADDEIARQFMAEVEEGSVLLDEEDEGAGAEGEGGPGPEAEEGDEAGGI